MADYSKDDDIRCFGIDITNASRSMIDDVNDIKVDGKMMTDRLDEPYCDKVYCMKEIFEFLIPREVRIDSLIHPRTCWGELAQVAYNIRALERFRLWIFFGKSLDGLG